MKDRVDYAPHRTGVAVKRIVTTGRIRLIAEFGIACSQAYTVSVPICRRADAGAVIGLERCQSPIAGHRVRVER
jgi:hypothetical protein